jgi:uncharacterized small protein (DUF1192 family)
MALVQTVAGPATARVGERVTYRVTAFSPPAPAAADRAAVRWLLKSTNGAALAHFNDRGADLQLTVPDAWAGQTAIVMPYMRSPSTAVSVTTRIAPATAAGVPGAAVTVRVVREGARYYASVDDEPRFFLGTAVSYGSRRGLMNSSNPPGTRYRAEDFETTHGDWAWYLLPTITCESQRAFTCLNTYDTACLTLGHAQLAAHTPDDNFVAFFRAALAQPPATAYFPDLSIVAGRIHQRHGGGVTQLESATDTKPLMAYFNATPDRVDDEEAERAARLVHWCVSQPAMRELQVSFVVNQQQRKMAGHALKLPLDGVVDKLCIVVLDILHQGRAKYTAIRTALAAADPFDALLGLGASTYKERVATLRAEIQKLEAQGRVGRKVYDQAAGDFVVPPGA